MSKWHESQKRLSGNFRSLLKKHIDKKDLRRELANDEAKCLNKLKLGENVQDCQLRTWLSEDEYIMIEAEWQEELELRGEPNEKLIDLRVTHRGLSKPSSTQIEQKATAAKVSNLEQRGSTTRVTAYVSLC